MSFQGASVYRSPEVKEVAIEAMILVYERADGCDKRASLTGAT